MKPFLFFLCLCSLPVTALGQRPLTDSRQSSYYTYIYPVKDEVVKLIYKSKEYKITGEVLTNPVDSFLTDRPHEVRLKLGNYLQVQALKNQLGYKLLEKRTAYLQLMENQHDLQFILTDAQGQEIKDANVSIDGRRIAYDQQLQLYHYRKPGNKKLLQVNYLGVTNFFGLTKGNSSSYHRPGILKRIGYRMKKTLNKKAGRHPYYYAVPVNPGYLVFNKPIYRPGDTVKLKAFVVDKHSKKPVKDTRLLVRLKDTEWDNGKIIGYVNAYRPGAFRYEFKLTDSLDLDLDDDYFISLEPLSSARYDLDNYDGDLDDRDYLLKRTVYQSAKFHYEDYELKVNHFRMRSDKDIHAPGSPVSLYFRANDENDLNVPDGRLELVATSYSVQNFKDDCTFVPDTLWHHRMPLESVGETKLTIPDSIFPRAEVHFRVEASFLNSSNELLTDSKYFSWRPDDDKDISAELSKDTLSIVYRLRGKETPATATLTIANSNKDTIAVKTIELPAKELLLRGAATYAVKVDQKEKGFVIHNFSAELSASGYRKADSLFIRITNPRNLDFWYTIFAGKKIIERGRADQLDYTRYFKAKKNVSVQLNYLWGGRPQQQEIRIPLADKLLDIQAEQPLTIYPGQQVTIRVNVKDYSGKPVEGADISAWSYTRKFENTSLPFVPYLGKEYPGRKYGPQTTFELPGNKGTMQLDWNRWSKEMGLDSITYYQFTHTPAIFHMEEPAPDSVTQIAPFVVKQGNILPVYIVYIDEKPVFFSQATQLMRYSFRVEPGRHKISLRTGDMTITTDSITVKKGNKHILAINAGAAPNPYVNFVKQKPVLSDYEARLINKYLISVVDNFDGRFATIEQGNRLFLLNPPLQSRYPQFGKNILTGPHQGFTARFHVQGESPVYFDPEPGYSFEFKPGLLKQTSLPASSGYPFIKNLDAFTSGNNSDYTQYALTRAELDSMWQSYLDLRSQTTRLFRNNYPPEKISGRLTVKIDSLAGGKFPFVKNIIVAKADDPDFICIYPGNTTNQGNFAPGKYRIFYLLKGNSYMLHENVMIRPYGNNLYRTKNLTVLPADSVSHKIARIIESRTGGSEPDETPTGPALALKETFNEKYTDNSSFTGEMRGVVYDASDKSVLPGVSIRVKGIRNGTATDVNGRFSIRVPASGKLLVQFVGYETHELSIRPGAAVSISLTPSLYALQEVVVAGYGTQKKQDLTGAVSTVQAGLMGSVAGVQVRGTSSLAFAAPLVVVDGVPFEGSVESLDPSLIKEITVLKNAAATALYGARAANGAIIVSTRTKQGTAGSPDENGNASQDQQQSIRKNFSDYAFWQPALRTDREGKTSFRVTFPDDITNWRTFFAGMTGNKQSGFAEGQIKSFKPVNAVFTSPLFAVKGDRFEPVGKLMNYTTDTADLQRTFTYNGKIVNENRFRIVNSKIDTFRLIAEGKDSLLFEYTIKGKNGYFDGEQRSIPLFEKGITETTGIFEALEKDTTFSLQFGEGSGKVTLRAEASLLPVLLQETNWLRKYEYLCNEQLASKLKGLLAEKKIRSYLNEPFRYEKDISELIKKLLENRRKEGAWGWWKDTNEELWITLHATQALLEAEKAGYRTGLDKQKLIDYLVYKTDGLKGSDRLSAIEVLRQLGAKADFKMLITEYEKQLTPKLKITEYEKMQHMLTRLRAGMQVNIDSLLKKEHHTMFGNVYWGDPGYRFFDNSVQLSLLAYQIIKEEGRHSGLLTRIRNYFLEQRKDGKWRNTFESALILETVLPDLLKEGNKLEPSSITLSGAKNETVTKFPYETTFDGSTGLTVSKKGGFPVYLTAYRQFFNPDPVKISKDFTVNTWFEQKENKVISLHGGQPVTLKAEVTARADADYVMIEIPIPAGCSYENKDQAFYSAGGEVHREYFKNKVNIFCSKLKQGRYVYSVRLVPRYGGNYTLNPAKAEMMYFPVFYGREEMKQVIIK